MKTTAREVCSEAIKLCENRFRIVVVGFVVSVIMWMFGSFMGVWKCVQL